MFRRDVQYFHEEQLHYRIDRKALASMIWAYLDAGLILEEDDPRDRRSKKIYLPDMYDVNARGEIE